MDNNKKNPNSEGPVKYGWIRNPSPEERVALISILPKVLTLLLVGCIILFFSNEIKKLLPNFSKVSAMGVNVEFVSTQVENASNKLKKLVETAGGKASNLTPEKIEVKPDVVQRVVDDVLKNKDNFQNAKILWIDDHPENNVDIAVLLNRLGARVITVRSNNEAEAELKRSYYDVIISDVGRDQDDNLTGPPEMIVEREKAGLISLELARKYSYGIEAPNVIFYTVRYDLEKPADAFDMTPRADKLLEDINTCLKRRYL